MFKSNYLKLTLVVLCISAISSCSCINLHQDQHPAIGLMSYNIRYNNPDDTPNWQERYPNIVQQIQYYAPDIIGLQEALIPMVNTLAEKLPRYNHYGIGRDDGQQEGESTTIFYKKSRFKVLVAETYWCSETPGRPSISLDAALPRTFTRMVLQDKFTRAILDVRNAHLDNQGAKSRLFCVNQIKALEAFPDAMVVALGDYNATPDSPEYQQMLLPNNIQLVDSRSIARMVTGPRGTFNDFHYGAAEGPLDYIFIQPGIVVERFDTIMQEVNGQVISDHYPIYAEIMLKRSKESDPKRHCRGHTSEYPFLPSW